jgi:hypothetical protein
MRSSDRCRRGRIHPRLLLPMVSRISTIAGLAMGAVASTAAAQTRGMVQVTALVTAAEVEWEAWAAARRLVVVGTEREATPGISGSVPSPLYQLERDDGLIWSDRRRPVVTVQYLRN